VESARSTESPEEEFRKMDVHQVLDAAVRESLRPVAVGLGGLYLVLAVAHAVVLPEGVALPMGLVASGTALVLFALYFVLGRWACPVRYAHPIGVGIAGLVLLNSLLHIYLASEPRQTTNVMLLIVGCGFLFLSARWLALTLIVTLGAWGLVAWALPPSPEWLHFGFALFTSTVLSLVVFVIRVRMYRRLEGLRLRDQRRTQELSLALRTARESGQKLRTHYRHLENLVQERTAELTAANRALQQGIAERRHAEARIARLAAVVEQATETVVITNVDGNIVYANPHFEVSTGYTVAEALGQNPRMLKSGRQGDVFYRQLWETITAGQTWTGMLINRRKDGSLYHEEAIIFPIRDTNGEIINYATVKRDTTERVRANRALQQYAERLRTLYALGGAILAAWSPEEIARSALRHIRRLIPCQEAGIVIFDFEAREAIPFAVQVGDDVRLGMGARLPLERNAGIDALRQGKILVEEDVLSTHSTDSAPGSAWSLVMWALPAEGVRSCVAVPLFARGELIGVLALGADHPDAFAPEHVDISREVADQIAVALHQARLHEQVQQHAAELELRVAERTAELSTANAELARAARMKDEFLAAVSHELRTPLNAILGLTQALEEEVYGPLSDQQQGTLHGIGQSGRHLLSLINDILDVAKIETGELELETGLVPVKDVCRASLGLVKQAAQKKGLRVFFSQDDGVTRIQADQHRLQQVLVNLLGNAVKFTPEGGKIGLEVAGDLEQDVVHFTVWDTGIGIAEDQIAHLFQPFVQLDGTLARRYSGTGLGLALVHRLTEMHGGAVSVESEVGRGSRFTVTLPRHRNGAS